MIVQYPAGVNVAVIDSIFIKCFKDTTPSSGQVRDWLIARSREMSSTSTIEAHRIAHNALCACEQIEAGGKDDPAVSTSCPRGHTRTGKFCYSCYTGL